MRFTLEAQSNRHISFEARSQCRLYKSTVDAKHIVSTASDKNKITADVGRPRSSSHTPRKPQKDVNTCEATTRKTESGRTVSYLSRITKVACTELKRPHSTCRGGRTAALASWRGRGPFDCSIAKLPVLGIACVHHRGFLSLHAPASLSMIFGISFAFVPDVVENGARRLSLKPLLLLAAHPHRPHRPL